MNRTQNLTIFISPIFLAMLLFIFLTTHVFAEVNTTSVKLFPIKFNPSLANLGKRLFFDKRLSGDASVSCASCHQPERGYSDGLALSDAYGQLAGFRNTPTLINVAHKSIWFHDGRMGTNLNDVVRDQLTDPLWMNMDMRIMQERCKQDPYYVKMFKQVLLQEPSNGGVRKALAEYLKSLQSKNVPFDNDNLTPQANRGWQLFQNKANCDTCHSGPMFTDLQPHNIGVLEQQSIFNQVGRSVAFIAFNMFMGNENYMNLRSDPGASVQHHRTNDPNFGAFITPTLRELSSTAPYMHNGTASDLNHAIKIHFQGKRITELIDVQLDEAEVNDLVAFLESLSGTPLSGDEFVWPQYKYIKQNYLAIPDWKNISN